MAQHLVPCIAVSTLYVLLTMFLAEAIRKVVEAAMPNKSLVKTAILEFVASAEMCGCGFELIIIADNYGVMSYAVFLFLLTIWWSEHWGEATACPYIHFEETIKGKMGVVETVVRTAAEIAGGILVFKYVQLLWAMEFAETHIGRPHSLAFNKCSDDLQVSVLLGFAIEGVATMLCRLTSKLLSDNEPQFANAIDSFVATALVVAAFDYSGGYYNPVLATGLKFGCRGHTNVEHVIVYWIGASLGAIAAMYAHPLVAGTFGVAKKKEA